MEKLKRRGILKAAGALVALLTVPVLAGCGAAQTLAQGVADKSLSGSGTVSIQRVGIDDETKTPVLKSTVITGDYASARNGDHAFQYRRKKSPSIFNSNAIEEEVTINFIGTREQALVALDVAKQDVNAAGAPQAVTPPEATTEVSPPSPAAASEPAPPADAAKK